MHCRIRLFRETSAVIWSFAPGMNAEHQMLAASQVDDLDRRVIRVDVAPAHAGIMAALRRAFEAASSEPCDRDFTELLRRLN
jgi:hypothetical protein